MPPPPPRPAVAVAVALGLAASLSACGGGSGGGAPTRTTLAPGWNPIPGMRCADGSPTGIGLSPGSSDAVLVYLAPGGACWGTPGTGTCPTSVPRAFGSGEYGLLQLAYTSGTIFDRTVPGNPFATWTQVFVPYCTGDVHAGDAVTDHGGTTWEHHGFRNLRAAIGAMTAALPRPGRLVVAGSSAGGFGALVAYDLVRAAWDPTNGTTAALLDDAGPTFVGTAIAPALLARWWDVWGLGSTVGATCPDCARDLSALWPGLRARHPQDRLALVSTTQDATMRGFFADPDLGVSVQTAGEFEANLDGLAAKLSGLGAGVASYRVGASYAASHALLATPYFFTSPSPQPPALLDWVSSMVALDPAWASSSAL
jgi:hypothetical protein